MQRGRSFGANWVGIGSSGDEPISACDYAMKDFCAHNASLKNSVSQVDKVLFVRRSQATFEIAACGSMSGSR